MIRKLLQISITCIFNIVVWALYIFCICNMRHSQKICPSSVQTISWLFWEEISLFNVILDIISFLLFPVSRMSQSVPMSPKFLLAISEFQGLNLYLWPICGSFVHCEWQRSGFNLLYDDIQFSQTRLSKTSIFFFSGCFLNFCQNSTGCRCVGSSVGFLFCSVGLHVCGYGDTTLYWLLWLCSTSWL